MTAFDVQLLTEKSGELAKTVVQLHFEHDPSLMERYGTAGKARCYEDAVYHLECLAEALTMELPDMYANYILWVAAMLKARNIPQKDIHHSLDFVEVAIRELLGSEFSSVVKIYTAAAREKLKENANAGSTFITDENPLHREANAYLEYLLKGKRKEASLMITKLLQEGISVKAIYQSIFQATQYEVGRLWQYNKITVAHEHFCTAATQQIMSSLYHYIFSATRNGKTLVACSIAGELHEMGIRMVTDFFEMDGWDTYYLGANVKEDHLEATLIKYKADVLALSVSLPTHISKVAALIKRIRCNSDLANLKIMVGGFPFLNNPDLWQRVGADASAKNAEQAISKANELVKSSNEKF